MSFSRDPSTWPPKPIIVITGGNGGVGFGVAERLLAQLSSPNVTDLYDALRLPASDVTAKSEFCTPNGLTLVIAARNAVKAHKATSSLLRAVGKKPPLQSTRHWRRNRSQLVKQFSNFDADAQDSQTPLLNQVLTEEEYRYRWLQNLSIEFVALDLSSVESVIHCCKELDQR
jgi:3-keto steroid reductase